MIKRAKKTDRITAAWIRNKSDELAVEDGAFFDIERGAWTVWWIEKFCKLYEGEQAGEPLLLRSGNPSLDVVIHKAWDAGGKELSLERAKEYIKWTKDGAEGADWQYECTMRMFGWAKYSPRWERNVRRFRQASIWIPKKQKKTPTLAAWGNYLTCGDGEMGAKTFGCAKDGGQAGIAMDHAMAMVEQDEDLLRECTINRNERSIFHAATRSKYRPLSSANSRNKKAKEGINGSLLVDETHVVDRDFMGRISRAGISRSEPMHIEVSTAGDDPDSYGKERYDLAKSVLAGDIRNDQMFVAVYEAPQNLTSEELEADPIKYGKMANPAWGHTAHEEEYLADYNESKRSLTELAKFMMYRLNVWRLSSDPWLRESDWAACASQFDFDDVSGLPCSVGLDLSKTRDMSAIAIAWDGGEEIFLKVRLWITQRYALANRHIAKFEEWDHKGDIKIIDGDVIRQSVIRRELERIAEATSIGQLVYDKTYAIEFVEAAMEDGLTESIVDYGQSAALMEKPIDDFEALVIDHRLRHDRNECLNWQARHVQTKENHREQRILVKPGGKDDVRKIDGMVASVMANWGLQHVDSEVAWKPSDGVFL